MKSSPGTGVKKFEPARHFTDYRTVDVQKEKTPRRRISFLRIFLSLVVIAVVGGGGYLFVVRQKAIIAATKVSYYAPYVDVTNTPYFQFQDPALNPTKQVVLGFIVSDHGACRPSWGGYYTMNKALQDLSLDNRIYAYKNAGGNVIASFGGEANTGLALACKSTTALTAAYQSVLNRYKLNTIDLDIEGTALGNWASIQRRSAALAALQQSYAKNKKPLNIWLTLPVATTGLDNNALSVLRSTLAHHVNIAGINLMTMDYAPNKLQTMAQMAETSVTNAEAQLALLYPSYGIKLSTAQIYKRIGITPMIGQNDIPGDIFTIQDAHSLVAFATAHGIGRLSMWSLNRDSSCGSSFTLIGVQSTTCSGIKQSTLQFSSIFNGVRGSVGQSENVPNPVPAVIPSNQLKNLLPFPAWQQTVTYPMGSKVVQSGNIYQSKYSNQGQDPAVQGQYSYQSPWQLVGPVLPSDVTPPVVTMPTGTYPAWSPTSVYQGGAKILFEGQPYQAKWYNQGTSPGAEPSNPSVSPWKPLFNLPGEPSDSGSL